MEIIAEAGCLLETDTSRRKSSDVGETTLRNHSMTSQTILLISSHERECVREIDLDVWEIDADVEPEQLLCMPRTKYP